MGKRAQVRWGMSLATIGFVIELVELGRYWGLAYEIHAWPVCIGLAFVFTGGWLVNPDSAERWSMVLTSRAVTIIEAMSGGRRTTDRIADAGGAVLIPPGDDDS